MLESNLWKVAEIFFQHPTKKHYIRQISRKIKLAPKSVSIYLQKLLKENIVEYKTDEIIPYYIAKRTKNYIVYKKIYNQLQLSELIEFIEDEIAPDSIVLFGSYAKGEDTETSDIDLFIQAKENTIEMSKFEKNIGRKIQLHFAENLSQLPIELKANVVNGVKLSGFLH